MIQVYKTKKGIKVREGAMSIDINPSTMGIYGTLYPEQYVKLQDDELVYTYYGELKVGEVYPAEAINTRLLPDGTVVISVDNMVKEAWQFNDHSYDETIHRFWCLAGAMEKQDDLPDGNYKILYLGEN